MSMSKCKCDKIMDTDEEFGFDEKGDSCCENCEQEMFDSMSQMIADYLAKLGVSIVGPEGTDGIGSLTEHLMNEGYRKIK